MRYSSSNSPSSSPKGAIHTAPQPLTRWHYINIFAYILNVVVTYGIGVASVLNRPTNAELSLKYQTLITPSGYAFAIWGLIFLAQFIWVVAQVVAKPYRNSDYIVLVGYKYLFVCLAQAGWSFSFSYEQIEVSLACMLSILFFLWRIVSALSTITENANFKNYMIWKFPFSVHFGWIMAASAVNVSVLLVDLGLSADIQFYAGLGSVGVLLVLGAIYANRKDITIPLVLVWALIGVYNELTDPTQAISGLFTANQIEYTQYAVLGVVVVLGLYTLLNGASAFRNRVHERHAEADETTYFRAEDH